MLFSISKNKTINDQNFEKAIKCSQLTKFVENYKKGKFNQLFFNQIIKGYQSKRTLTEKEKKQFKIILRGASLRFLLTRLYDFIHKKKNSIVTFKDPVEYYSILTFHIQSQKRFNYFK